MLVPVPEEAEIVKTIFDLYIETDSLTAVETEMLRRRIKTKLNKDFTRFAIKGILRNPVYMIADKEAYQYFVDRKADVCFPKETFDGSCGVMAYNRTDQEKGRTTVVLPVCDWIVALGRHPGLIPSAQWIKVQESLDRNKSKAYRKPRYNEALLTGLLFRSCGDRMYPKLSQRKTAEGESVYTYVCKMKERSKKERCSCRNACGNNLDAAIIQKLKSLPEDDSSFVVHLEKSRQLYRGNRRQHEDQLAQLHAEFAEKEKMIAGLIDSLAMVGDSVARPRVLERIEDLAESNHGIENRIRELERMTAVNRLDDIQLDFQRQMLMMFCTNVDKMSVEERRSMVRTVVRKVIWDGENAHVVLIGADEGNETDMDIKTIWGEGSK